MIQNSETHTRDLDPFFPAQVSRCIYFTLSGRPGARLLFVPLGYLGGENVTEPTLTPTDGGNGLPGQALIPEDQRPHFRG